MTFVRVLDPESVDSYWLARYLHFLFERGLFKGLCWRYVGQASVGLEKLRHDELLLPPINIQRSISRTLHTVQQAAAARRREAALQRERKAALMQRLFTEGTRRRNHHAQKTRFGSIPASWQVAPLKECAFVQTGIAKGRRIDTGTF